LTSPDGWLFRIGKSDRIVPIRPRLLLNSAEAAIDASIAGLGVTRVLSYQIARAHQDGLLEVALAEFEPTPWPVSLVYASQGRLPLKVRAFLDFAAPRLRKAMLRNGL
jgi:DNA-binding transcriptional LysR family regulator